VMITSGKVDRSLNVDVADARGLAFDGQRLWIADGGGNTLIPINVQTGESLEGIKLGESPLGAWDSIEDISWDGKSLWVVCNGGYSSMFNQVDPETGGIMRSVFANCNPRGIATDGKSIWSICYNGDKFPSKIDVRSILPKDHEMQTSRRFLVDIESKAPVGLAIDSNGLLWYADEATSTAYRVRLRDPRGGK
jgi:DNA-binding beta-propeller fold protein YncE